MAVPWGPLTGYLPLPAARETSHALATAPRACAPGGRVTWRKPGPPGPLALLPDRHVLGAVCCELRAVPAGPAVLQAHPGGARHEVHLGGPGIPERDAPKSPLPIRRHGDVVRREPLRHDVVLVEPGIAAALGAGRHRKRDGVLPRRQAPQARHPHLDEEQPA